jgi:drug/metabolite transporter (DMT)-like permease
MKAQGRFVPYLLLVTLGLVWGSSFILMKKGLLSFSPVEVAAYRLFTAGLVLLPVFISWFGKAGKKNFKWFFLSGLLGNGLPAFMFTYAQTRLTSSTAGALNALTPLFALLIGVFIFKLRLGFFKTLGVLTGLAGALLLIFFKPENSLGGDFWYCMLLVLAALLYGINVNIIKQKFADSKPMVIAAFPLVFMAVPSFFILCAGGFFTQLTFSEMQLESLGYITLLSVFGTAVSLIIFNRLIQMTNAVFASFTTYLMPVVALMWGALDGEKINTYQITGLTLILLGVLAVNRAK